MKRYVHTVKPVAALSKFFGFKDSVNSEDSSALRNRRFVKALTSIQEEEEATNKCQIQSLGNDNFKLKFDDGRQLNWNTTNLPSDWIEIFWNYVTSNKQMPSAGYMSDNEPGSLFDSKASTDIN